MADVVANAITMIEIYPAHIVNAWMGHTEAVAMAHYRQTTGKAADKFYAQAAGIAENTAVQKTVGGHAGTGCFGVEVAKTGIAITPYISTACNESQESAHGQKTQKWRHRDSNPGHADYDSAALTN